MNIKVNNENSSIYFGNARSEESQTQKENGVSKSGSIFMGNVNKDSDNILMRKIQLRKEAMKGILDQFAADSKIDEDLKARENRMSDLDEQMSNLQKEYNNIEEKKAKLKEEYGITDDSQEGPEEYNEQMKTYAYDQGKLKEEIDISQEEKLEHDSVIKATKKELLKTHPMADAQAVSKEMKLAASKEIAGMLMAEAKDHIDEEMEKQQEEAEKIKEKKEEQEEKLEAAKEKREEVQEHTENIAEAAEAVEDMQDPVEQQRKIQSGIKNLIDNKLLLEEDLKGLDVNEEL